MRRRNQRPPFPEASGITLSAVYLAAPAALLAPMTLVGSVIDIRRGDWSIVLRSFVILLALLPLCGIAVLLALRKRWARIVALPVCGALTLVSAAGAVWPFVSPPENGHGVMYTIMGALMWTTFGAFAFVSLLLTGPEKFVPCGAGWFRDPARLSSLRYWDGRSWTDATAP